MASAVEPQLHDVPTPSTSVQRSDAQSGKDYSEADSKPESLLSSRVIVVLVGPSKTRFHMHEAILKHAEAGELFNKATQNGFLESSGVLELPVDDAAIFKIFSKWLYTKTLNPTFNADWDLELAEGDGSYVDTAIKLYCFAFKNEATALQDRLISFVFGWIPREAFDMVVGQESVEHLVRIASGSHMHQLLIKWMAADTLNGAIFDANFCDLMPVETVRAVLRYIGGVNMQIRDEGAEACDCIDELLGTRCDYHTHGLGACCDAQE